MRFKLKDGITDVMTLRFMEKRGVNRVYTHKTFEPGEEYEFDGEDEVLRETLLKATVKIKKRDEMVRLLEENGIEYKLIKPTCRCQKVPFIEFNPVEEV